jgi:hypothetical protein
LSYNVLVISEDYKNDQHVLRPLVSRLLRECHKPRANVSVWANLAVRGFERVRDELPAIVRDSPQVQLFLFLPDCDGQHQGRADLFANLEAQHAPKLICCAAVEEVEAWLLAGHIEKLDRPWPAVRGDKSVKENVFNPFLEAHGNPDRPGGGREELMQQTLTNLRGLLERCPELARLRERICEALA